MCSNVALSHPDCAHEVSYTGEVVGSFRTSSCGTDVTCVPSTNPSVRPIAPVSASIVHVAEDDASCRRVRGSELSPSTKKERDELNNRTFPNMLDGVAATMSLPVRCRASDERDVVGRPDNIVDAMKRTCSKSTHVALSVPLSRGITDAEVVLTQSSCHRYDVGRFTDAATCSLDTEERVQDAFEHSARLRTIGNAQLCKYIKTVPPEELSFIHAAMRGAVSGGLRLNKLSYETAIDVFVRDGELRSCMTLYQEMIRLRMTPTARTYVTLMQITLDGNMPSACQSLFREMQKCGVRPMAQNYALVITSMSYDSQPNVDEAIRLFDKISRNHRDMVTLPVYNALMMVYLKMQPFDWRVVYNCYYEMRTRLPRIPLEWSSYYLVSEAMRRGRVDYVRRIITFADAWVNITQPWSREYIWGGIVFGCAAFVVKLVLSMIFCALYALVVHPRITSQTNIDSPYS